MSTLYEEAKKMPSHYKFKLQNNDVLPISLEEMVKYQYKSKFIKNIKAFAKF